MSKETHIAGKGVRPFADHGHFTATHNLVYDYIMPRVSGNAFKVLCLIIRQTKGRGKSSDEISYSQIQAGTGIKSDATISKALKQLIEDDYILKKSGAGQFDTDRYALNKMFAIPASVNEAASIFEAADEEIPASENEAATTSKNEAAPASKNEDTERQYEETNKVLSPRARETEESSSSPDQLPSERNAPLLVAVLDVIGKRADWQRGTVSSRMRQAIETLLQKLEADERSIADIATYAEKFPSYLGRDPTTVTPPTPTQMLDNFDAVMNFKPAQRELNGHHGTYSNNRRPPARGLGDISDFTDGVTSRRNRAATSPASGPT